MHHDENDGKANQEKKEVEEPGGIFDVSNPFETERGGREDSSATLSNS